MAKLTDLRPACRLRPGETSADCPDGSAGSIDGRLDEADLPPEIQILGFRARFAHLERHPNDFQGARAAQVRTLAPHLDSLNRAAQRTRKEDSHVCNCKKPDHGDGARVDDVDDYDFDGGRQSQAAMHRAAAAQLGEPSVFRDGAHAPSAPARQDDDTDENAAARRMRGQWIAGRR
jgi:hypothetical protein